MNGLKITSSNKTGTDKTDSLSLVKRSEKPSSKHFKSGVMVMSLPSKVTLHEKTGILKFKQTSQKQISCIIMFSKNKINYVTKNIIFNFNRKEVL